MQTGNRRRFETDPDAYQSVVKTGNELASLANDFITNSLTRFIGKAIKIQDIAQDAQNFPSRAAIAAPNRCNPPVTRASGGRALLS